MTSERTMIARLAAHEKWAKCENPTEATAAARRAFQTKFQEAADPDGSLRRAIENATGVEYDTLIADLRRRVEHARKAYYTRLALASARARRNKS